MDLIHLKDIIDIDILQEIQDQYAQATGFAAVTVDYKGNPITKYSNFSRFCKLIRQDKKCRTACYQSDAYGGLDSVRTEGPAIYKCPMGLVDFAVPISVNGQYFGSILSGQAKVEDDKLIGLDNITKQVRDWTKDPEIVKAYDEIEITPYNKIVAAARMMFYMSNYIVEKGMVNLVQKELNNKSVKLLEEMKVRSELEKDLKDAELKFLQSQINPHFLFNVLNTIGRLSLIENANRTQETVHYLAEMLRYTLKNSGKMVFIEEAILYIEKYFKIQTIRFRDRVKFKINIPDEIKKVKLPFMTLQPFVENVINHCLEAEDEGVTVNITGYTLQDDVIIEICDNGVGIEEDKLSIILDENKDNSLISKSTGIGIRNINRTLKYYYGNDYGVSIKSKLNEGTTVKIKIPRGMV